MQIVVITPEKDLPFELELVNSLFEMGLEVLHLRKPGYNEVYYERYITGIRPEYHSRVVIHGAYGLFRTLDLRGVHLRSAIRHDEGTLDQLRNVPCPAISTSFHSWAEIAQNETPYGSVFISPLYNSISKPGYGAAVAPEGITDTLQQLNSPGKHCPRIIGLGGVNKANISTLKKLGYDGAALLGAIWNDERPLRAFGEIQNMLPS